MYNVKTKIIATLGPSSNTQIIISSMIEKGMDVARINMSHFNTIQDFESIIKIIRSEAKKQLKHVGILVDLAGPKIRLDLHHLKNEILKIQKGKIYKLGFSKDCDIKINANITFKENNNIDESFVKIDDGKVIFKVVDRQINSLSLEAQSDTTLYNKKGVNFPGIQLNIPPLTVKDKEHIKLALKNNVDWLALSFVRESSDIKPIIDIFKKEGKIIPVIAKIEKPEAISNLDSIIDKFQGILIARGDLGVEVALAKLPGLQKLITNKCIKSKKPVIVATQMLESMIENPTPTRAEVNDVANAVYESVDAVMLSGETAIGKYPIDSVNIMNEILLNAEKEINRNNVSDNMEVEVDPDIRSAIGESVKLISNHLNIDAIVVMTESGNTAIIVSHYRPKNSIFALTQRESICNKLALVWGVVSILTPEFKSTDEMINEAQNLLIKNKLLKYNDTFVLTAGVPIGISGATNMLKIHKIVEKIKHK